MNLANLNIFLNIFDKLKDLILWLFKNKAKFKKASYYFKDYHKHVTVYDNGNGILINSFNVVFNKMDVKKIVRGINISDGKIQAEFPSFEKMKAECMKNRFDSYGFWVYSDNNIIEESKEEYWIDDEKEQEDMAAKNSNKELRWVLKLNSSKIELHKPYRVIYVMSIPGMFPINDGILDSSEIDPQYFDGYSSSSIEIETPIEEIHYIVSFYNSISLQMEPEATVNTIGSNRNSPLRIEREYNIIYNKYKCYIRKPQLGSKLKIKWKFKGGKQNGQKM